MPSSIGHRTDATFVSVGKGLSSWGPGWPINGIQIDNDTGNWLAVRAGILGNFTVAPYTYGWSQPLVGAQSIDVTIQAGPAIFPSQNIGTGVTITVTDDVETPVNQGYNAATAVQTIVIPGSTQIAEAFVSTIISTIITLGSNLRALCPTTPLVGRLALMLQSAQDNTATIYVGGISVTADETATGGIEMLPGMSLPIDASDLAAVYAITPVGGTKLIVIEGK